MTSKEYNELDTRQQCRQKLPIWYGSRENFYHGLQEVLMNANDELNVYGSSDGSYLVSVALNEQDRIVRVKDTGRGIPLDSEHNGKMMYELLFETLFAGSNFDNASSNKETTGTNGCGLTVLNHTSTMFQCESCYQDKASNKLKYGSVYYENGVLVHDEFKSVPFSSDKLSDIGTTFRFKLDEEMYTSTRMKKEVVKQMCNHLAGVSNKVTIVFKELNDDEPTTYHYDSVDAYMMSNCQTTLGKQYSFPERTKEEVLKSGYDELTERNRMVLSWSIGTEPFQETFLNSTFLKNGGTIYDGVVNGFRLVMDKYSSPKIKITADDIESGLNFVCSLNTNNVEFEGQTKFSTKKKSYKDHVSKYVSDNLEVFRLENQKEFSKILDHFVEINNHNRKTSEDIKKLNEKIKKKSKGGLSIKVDGLIDCDMRKSRLDERILIIDEGKSANSTIIASRDSRTMGCIGLRGRFINSYKTTIQNVFKNEEAIAIMTALGCGIELPEKERKRLKGVVSFDRENLRYGNIAIMTDMDWAGKAIALSLLSFFRKFYPTLCDEGRIYVVQTPRYIVYDSKSNEHYAYDEKEKTKIVDKLGKSFSHLGIVKGLGELDKEQFWKFVLSPEAREQAFTQIDWSGNQDEIEDLFMTTMGDRIDERKQYIIDNVVNKAVI